MFIGGQNIVVAMSIWPQPEVNFVRKHLPSVETDSINKFGSGNRIAAVTLRRAVGNVAGAA